MVDDQNYGQGFFYVKSRSNEAYKRSIAVILNVEDDSEEEQLMLSFLDSPGHFSPLSCFRVLGRVSSQKVLEKLVSKEKKLSHLRTLDLGDGDHYYSDYGLHADEVPSAIRELEAEIVIIEEYMAHIYSNFVVVKEGESPPNTNISPFDIIPDDFVRIT